MTTILTGSYERFLFGFEVGGKDDKVRAGEWREMRERERMRGAAAACSLPSSRHRPPLSTFSSLPPSPQPSTLTRSFYVPVHKGPVKCVAAATPFAATGGTDDCIHLFDVRVRVKGREREREIKKKKRGGTTFAPGRDVPGSFVFSSPTRARGAPT